MQTAEENLGQNQEKKESLPNAEIFQRETVHDSQDRVELSPARVEKVMKERAKMLGEIKDALSPRLAEALKIKIDHERDSLLQMIHADVQTQEVARKRNKVLPHDFFKKQLLNPNSL